MAVTKQDVLSFIAEHITSDRSKVPAKDIIAALGSEAKAVIEQLKKDGTIKGNRGRNGGLTVAGEVQETAAVEDNSAVVDQFAALMAKLECEQADTAVAVDNTFDSEQQEAAVG